jgi:hypothetical protein
MKKKQKKMQLPENLEKGQNEGLLVNEPAEIYANQKALQFFSTFEDENEATARLNAQLKPKEHLKNAHQLILAIYAKELQNLEHPYYNLTFVIKDGIPC